VEYQKVAGKLLADKGSIALLSFMVKKTGIQYETILVRFQPVLF